MPNPIKTSIKSEAVPILAIITSVILSFYFYPRFPEQVAVHWGWNGQPNGFGGRFEGAFAIPLLLIGIYILFFILPMIDPNKERYKEFLKPYHFFKGAIILILFALFAFSGFYNLGYKISINNWVPALVGLLMIVIGNYMGKLKKNWFMGIRTPWTLSSENVWNKTHRLGGIMFIIFGIILILAPFLPKTLGLAAFTVGICLIIFGTIIYSYWLYRKEKNGQQI